MQGQGFEPWPGYLAFFRGWVGQTVRGNLMKCERGELSFWWWRSILSDFWNIVLSELAKTFFFIFYFVSFFISQDGYTYERASIDEWLTSGRLTSPMTNAPLKNSSLTPNRMLFMLIQRHFSGQNINVWYVCTLANSSKVFMCATRVLYVIVIICYLMILN